MQYIRVMEAQTNIQTALRLRNDIDVSVGNISLIGGSQRENLTNQNLFDSSFLFHLQLKKSNSIAGKKRPRNEMQIGPISKRARNHSSV